MKIYHIDINGLKFPRYDVYDGHVIVAFSERECINMAASQAADEGAEIWEKAKISIIGDYTGDWSKPFILLSSFNAG